MRIFATLSVAFALVIAAGAPFVTPNDPQQQFGDLLFAPPMRPRVFDDQGRWRAPFVYPVRLVDRLERRYTEDRSTPLRLRFFTNGRLIGLPPDGMPLLLLGADSFGRDVFSRLITGARVSLGVAALGVLGALLLGAAAGSLAGYAGGFVDEGLMRLAEFVVVLPIIYVVLALRAVLPLVLAPSAVFVLMVAILSFAGWPHVARGVRAIVEGERHREYFDAARSLGSGHVRLLVRHLLPATAGFLLAEALLLLPSFILAEATLSYLGLGFAEPMTSWGAMLAEAANVRAMADFPWVLSPAVAIVLVVLAVNLRLRASALPI